MSNLRTRYFTWYIKVLIKMSASSTTTGTDPKRKNDVLVIDDDIALNPTTRYAIDVLSKAQIMKLPEKRKLINSIIDTPDPSEVPGT